MSRQFLALIAFICLIVNLAFTQVTININSGNPNFPFPQFKKYPGSAFTLAEVNPIGVPHAELEQRTRDAYKILSNNMTYNVLRNGTYAPITVNGVRYIMPNQGNGSDIDHCTCVEGDGYYLLAAAYMADKATFDGYYMWAHDRAMQKRQRYVDCVVNSPGYNYSPGLSGGGSFGANLNVEGGGLAGNSAADGDVDVAMALMIAWKQWGDNGIITTNPCTGTPIYYREEAIRYIKAMVDTTQFMLNSPPRNYITGIIGLDGYMKNGDSWNEITSWATPGYTSGGKTMIPETKGPQFSFVDYHAPAYFRSFANMLTAEGESPWCIEQYKRAEASSDWVIKQAYNQGLIPWIGQVNINNNGSVVAFNQFNPGGEDFRYGWRTAMNHMWNGLSTRTWNPVTHQYTNTSNNYEQEMALRFASFLHHPENPPFNNTCFASSTGINYGGTTDVRWTHDMNGTNGGGFRLNFIHGCGSPSAVVSQNWDLMSQMFRQCVIEWDEYSATSTTGTTQNYLTSKPRYFHEWFRMLGMLVLAGNLHDPMQMLPQANMKVYKSVNKTYAYVQDTITYTISYRNYGKPDGLAVVVKDTLSLGLNYVNGSSTKPISVAGNILTWNVGTVKGMNGGNVNLTKDSITFKVVVNASAPSRICNTSAIFENGIFHWKSNEYPNRITDVMERNCVDILPDRPLSIKKTASKSLVQVGDTLSYTIVVKNKPTPFLNGGRQGVVIAGAHSGLTASQSQLTLKYRIYHGAHEPLINYRNYRISYFLNKPGPPTWLLATDVNEGSSGNLPSLAQQKVPIGATWNHRFILTFPNQRATITPMLYTRYNSPRYIHEGAMEPMRLVSRIFASGSPNYDFSAAQDWSAEPGISGADGTPYFPLANDFTDPTNPNLPVTKIHPQQCGTVTNTVKRQLAEEWDGYTWRRIYGDAPVSGRELNNLVIKDILPAEVNFGGFMGTTPPGTFSGNTITWPTIAQLLTNDSITYKFWVTVKSAAYFNCPSPGPTPSVFTNYATAKATNEPLSIDSAKTNVSCTAVPPPLIPTTMSKRANKVSYNVGDNIIYTIGYKQTHGGIYNKPTSMAAADWTTRVGSATLSATTITTVSNTGSLLTNNFAHGTNGTLTFTVAPSQYSTFGIALRKTPSASFANGLYITFKYDNSTVIISLYNGATLVTSNTVAGPFSPPLVAGTTFNHKIVLNGTNASIFINDMSVPITSFSALPITSPGYVGVTNGTPVPGDNNGVHRITNWNSNFDSSFDLQLTDPIPTGITFVSATNANLANCPSCGAGPITGANTAGTVTYQKMNGPVLKGDSVTYVWNGTVASCTGGTITNTASMNLFGISPNPAAQVVSNCLTATPLDFIYFEVHQQGKSSLLKWKTINEQNCDKFVIERSIDKVNFYPFGTVKANNKSGVQAYQFVDNYSSEDILVYYRIKQVDYDLYYQYSAIKSIALDEINVRIYPNPFNASFEISCYSNSSESIHISIYNSTGQLVYTSEFKAEQGENKYLIQANLVPGVYQLEFKTDTSLLHRKILRE